MMIPVKLVCRLLAMLWQKRASRSIHTRYLVGECLDDLVLLVVVVLDTGSVDFEALNCDGALAV